MDNLKNEISKICQLNSKNLYFFERLLKKLEPDFTRESVRKERNKSQGDLSESIQQYFKYYIILDAVIKSEDFLALSPKKSEALCHMKSAVTSNLDIPPLYLKSVPFHLSSNKLECVGLNQEFIRKTLLNKKKSQSKLLEFTKMIETNISEFIIKLTEYSGQKNIYLGNEEKAFKETMKDLSAKAVILDSGNTATTAKQHILQDMLLTYYKELTEGLAILSQLLNSYERKSKFGLNLAKYYDQRSECLCLKIKLFELDVMKATYTRDTLPALRIIRENLDAKEEKLFEDLDSNTAMLQAYQALGPKYEEIVEKYTELCKSVDKQKWSMLALQKNNKQGEISLNETCD